MSASKSTIAALDARRGRGTRELGYGYSPSARWARELDSRSDRRQQEASAMLDRLMEVWPADVRRQCLGLPIDEDPIYWVVRAARGDGVSMVEIADAYGVSRERIRQVEARGLYTIEKRREFALAWRDRVDGINAERTDAWESAEAMGW